MNNFSQVNVAHFQNLVALAYSDSYISQEEMKFLTSRAVAYGITDKKAYETIEKAKDIKVNDNVITSEKEKQLSDFIYMSVMDGILRTDEYELCLRLGEKLGFDKKTVEDLIQQASKEWLVQNGIRRRKHT